MTTEPLAWDRLEELFEEALATHPLERGAFLDRVCGADASLRAELEAMLYGPTGGAERGIDRLLRDAATPDTDPMVGAKVGHWRVVSQLGRGGMGVVYLVERADGEYQQRAALKLVAPARHTPESVERFRAERQVLARLQHPSIARLLDGGFAGDGRPFLVMEYVEGEPITDYCRTRDLPIAARLQLLRVVCEAVQHAHAALVVHRDIKPDNTMVSPAGDVKLLDFGVAKLLEPRAFGLSDALTRDRGAPLTPQYAAPEQLLGGEITTATDVYALGVLAYELLTGGLPVDLAGKSPAEIERTLDSPRIVPPSERLGGRRRRDLDAIVLTALRSAPERRYLSAGQLGEDIGRYLAGHPVIARPDTLAYRTRRFVARHRVAVGAAALVAAGLLGFGGVAAWQAREAALERDLARAQSERAERLVGVLVELFEGSNPMARPGGDSVSVREFLARAEPRVLDRLEGHPITRARLLHVFGRIYSAQDRYPEARRALEQALAEQRRMLGPDHPDALETLHDLGVLLRTTGDRRAREVLEESLDRTRRVHGEEHVRTARALAALGHVSIDHLRRAIAIQQRLLPPEHPDRVTSQTELAGHLRESGDLDGARAIYLSALAAFPTPEHRRHPAVLTLMSDYAAVLRARNEVAAAEAWHREIDATARVVLGPESRVVALNLNNLAVLVSGQGRFADAEALFREAHTIQSALLGRTHLETTSIARSLGTAIGLQERWAEALPWIEESLAGLDPERDLRAWHSRRTNLARVLHRLGRSREALQVVSEAVAAFRPRTSEFGTDPLREALFWQALVYIDLGRPVDGELAAREAMQLFQPAGEPGIRRAGAECLVGWAMLLTGREPEGRRILARALPPYAAWGRADREMVARLQSLVGQGTAAAR